jgi:hypothetical protein
MEYYLPPLLPVIPGKFALVIPANMCYINLLEMSLGLEPLLDGE